MLNRKLDIPTHRFHLHRLVLTVNKYTRTRNGHNTTKKQDDTTGKTRDAGAESLSHNPLGRKYMLHPLID